MVEIATPAPIKQALPDRRIREVSEKLEASFLAEMLKSTGLGETTSSFSGGEGASQFASFMRDALAERMVDAGGIGLADAFYKSITEMENAKTK